MKLFNCALFIDDGLELETIVEGKVQAKNGNEAVSLLLSEDAGKRRIPYYWLKEKVKDSLVKEVDN